VVKLHLNFQLTNVISNRIFTSGTVGEGFVTVTELRRGWWRITDGDQLRTILENLHSRGVRERELKRILSKYIEHTVECSGKVTICFLLYGFSSYVCP
jgi:hypothetical protein